MVAYVETDPVVEIIRSNKALRNKGIEGMRYFQWRIKRLKLERKCSEFNGSHSFETS